MPKNRAFTIPGIGQLVATTSLVVLLSSLRPSFAQQVVHVETTVTNISNSNFSYGPVGPNCNANSGGSACLFVSFNFSGTCTSLQQGGGGGFHHGDDWAASRRKHGKSCTYSGSPTILLSSSPSGTHDANGNSTGSCYPFVESLSTTYDNGSTLVATGQGTICCAATDTCSGGFGPPFVVHEANIITGGTGALQGITGSGLETTVGYTDGTQIAQIEQVWLLPGD